MQIFTYFDASILPKPELQGPVISHWYHSWKSHGWDPRMLTPRTWATDSKLARRVKNALDRYGFPNIVWAARVGACAAIEAIKADVYFVEYDVINFDFRPNDRFLHLEGLRWKPTCLLDLWEPRCNSLRMHGDPFWEKAPLVRFSGPNKATQIENCGREY